MTGTQVAITIAHALVGWALCGATMSIVLARTTLKRALVGGVSFSAAVVKGR